MTNFPINSKVNVTVMEIRFVRNSRCEFNVKDSTEKLLKIINDIKSMNEIALHPKASSAIYLYSEIDSCTKLSYIGSR